MFLTRVRSTPNTCARNVKSWATTAAVCNNPLYSEPESSFCVPGPIARPTSRLLTSSPHFQVSLISALHTTRQPFLLPSSPILLEDSNIDSDANRSFPASQPRFFFFVVVFSDDSIDGCIQEWEGHVNLRINTSKCSSAKAKTSAKITDLFFSPRLACQKPHDPDDPTPRFQQQEMVRSWISVCFNGLGALPHRGIGWLRVYRYQPSSSLPSEVCSSASLMIV